ncbi:MAG TPA: MarR family transcriptional regulator [Candidatus Pelethocola excrementipullorum]|nr:MarR family transcriptional regulator [Candidatus Pelethocola excrementipullorum]
MHDSKLIENGTETIQVFSRLWLNTKKNLPVRFSEMRLLLLLEKNKEPITPVEAAEVLGIKKQMITTMANVLEKKGYIIKSPSTTDRRSHILSPTQKGRDLVHHRYAEYFRIVNTIKEKLGKDDFVTFITLLTKINTVLQEASISQN